MRIIAAAVAVLASLASEASLATTVPAAETHTTGPLAGWTTTSHLGFGVVGQSTTGFAGSTGSLVYLDASRPAPFASPRLSVGLRTLAQGGRAPNGEYYRLGAGPLAAYEALPGWHIQAGLQAFRETALTPDGATAYRSRGYAALLGWDRHATLTERAAFTWGGFVSRHQGSGGNAGLTRAVSLGLVVRL